MDDAVADRVAAATGSAVAAVATLEGGHVGTVRRLDLADGRAVVAKTGDAPLDVEGAMLRYLAAETALPVPAVHHAAADLLVVDFVPGDDPVTPAVQRDLADHVAALHATAADAAGFHFDTLSGPFRQPNPWTDSWVEFYREFRLRHAADRALADGSLPPALHRRIGAACEDLGDLLVEPAAPALVHGDLWTGNLRVDGGEVLAVLDPALYFGHPEVDLAYLLWTDTVGDPFLARYRQRRGLVDGFDRRRAAYDLLPLVEHVRVFGGEYRDALADRLADLGR